jgi:cytoskeletal protein CcmA (bactofilin family)
MFLKSNKNAPKIETVVGPDTELEGNVSTRQSLRIDGKIKGEVKAISVIIGEFGVVTGDVTATNVTVAGKVKGNISAKEAIELLPKAQILGDIRTNKLVISDGACFEGNCQMIKNDGQVIELNPQAGENKHQNSHPQHSKAVANANH